MIMQSKKVAIVTGSASGIGKAIAERFAKEGISVMLTDVNSERLTETEKDFKAKGYLVDSFLCDITNEASVKELMEKAISCFQRIDILVNCAGISPVGRVTDISEADFKKAIEINLVAPFLTSKYVLPYMMENKSGSITNIVGTLGSKAIRSKAAYCASKAGILNLTKQMALDYGDYGIRVNAVSPGFADTPLNSSMDDSTRNIIIESQALHTAIEASDIAEAVAFISSDAARLITGANLTVDAGQSASQGSLSAVDFWSIKFGQ